MIARRTTPLHQRCSLVEQWWAEVGRRGVDLRRLGGQGLDCDDHPGALHLGDAHRAARRDGRCRRWTGPATPRGRRGPGPARCRRGCPAARWPGCRPAGAPDAVVERVAVEPAGEGAQRGQRGDRDDEEHDPLDRHARPRRTRGSRRRGHRRRTEPGRTTPGWPSRRPRTRRRRRSTPTATPPENPCRLASSGRCAATASEAIYPARHVGTPARAARWLRLGGRGAVTPGRVGGDGR